MSTNKTYYYVFMVFILLFSLGQLNGMKRSSNLNFAVYIEQNNKDNVIYLLDVLSGIIKNTMIKNIEEDVIKERNNRKESDQLNDKAQKISFNKDVEYKVLRGFMEGSWNNSLDGSYLFSSDDFIAAVETTYQMSEKHRQIIHKKDEYTLKQLVKVIVDLVKEEWALKIFSAKCIIIMRETIVSYVFNKFLKFEQQLSWCECPRVSLGERIFMLITGLEKLYDNYKPEECTLENPLIYTNFGSGLLLYDHIFITILIHCGYYYFKLNFIDTYYDADKYFSCKKMIEQAFSFHLKFFKGDISFKCFGSTDEYLANSSNKNHFISTIDTTHFESSLLEFETLIRQSATSKTIIGLLAEHEIRYDFNSLFKN